MGCGVHAALFSGSLVCLSCCIEEVVEMSCIVQWGQRRRGEGIIAGVSGQCGIAVVGQPQNEASRQKQKHKIKNKKVINKNIDWKTSCNCNHVKNKLDSKNM